MSDYDSVRLLPHQRTIFMTLAEDTIHKGIETVPNYILAVSFGNPGSIIGADVDLRARPGDLVALSSAHLISVLRIHNGAPESFVISPFGFEYYQWLQGQSGDAIHRIEEEMSRLLDGEFQSRHPDAYYQWSEAARLLWSDDLPDQLTTIGHYCREAMRQLSFSLGATYRPEKYYEATNTMARLRAVVTHQKDQLGDRERKWIEALADYWYSVYQLTNVQEHASERQDTHRQIDNEDARRIVFQTLVAMTEIDQCLARTKIGHRYFLVKWVRGPANRISAGQGKPKINPGEMIELMEQQIHYFQKQGHRFEGYSESDTLTQD